jgi:gluconolactonase
MRINPVLLRSRRCEPRRETSSLGALRPYVQRALIASLLASSLGHPASVHAEGVLVDGAKVEKIAGGLRFTEGPAFRPGGTLYFSDIPANRILKVGAENAIEVFLEPSDNSNGLAFDAAGRLYACQHGARRVVSIDPDRPEDLRIVADSFEGKKLNSPNDLALDADGGIYFTDPRYGDGPALEQPVKGVYYVAADGAITRVIDTLKLPNGIGVSPDGKTLYVVENASTEIFRWQIESPGKLGESSVFFKGDNALDGGGSDGIALDSEGNVWATYRRGITVIAPDGSVVERIAVPEHPANCTLGGPDGKTLFITARTGLYAAKVRNSAMALQPKGPAGRAAAKGSDEPKALRKVKFGALELEVPESWKARETKAQMRMGEFVIDPVEGDSDPSELAVFHFPTGVGGLDANVERWIG